MPGSLFSTGSLAQSFDNVVPPMLPPDWLATNALGPPPLWVTSNSGLPMPPADTLPNAAFVDDPGVVSDKRLDSHFPVSGAVSAVALSNTISISKRRTWTQTLGSMEVCWR